MGFLRGVFKCAEGVFVIKPGGEEPALETAHVCSPMSSFGNKLLNTQCQHSNKFTPYSCILDQVCCTFINGFIDKGCLRKPMVLASAFSSSEAHSLFAASFCPNTYCEQCLLMLTAFYFPTDPLSMEIHFCCEVSLRHSLMANYLILHARPF